MARLLYTDESLQKVLEDAAVEVIRTKAELEAARLHHKRAAAWFLRLKEEKDLRESEKRLRDSVGNISKHDNGVPDVHTGTENGEPTTRDK